LPDLSCPFTLLVEYRRVRTLVNPRNRPTGWRSSMAEHLFCKQVVRGSSPLASSIRCSPGASDSRGRTKEYSFGGLPEWPKGADCKSAGYAFDGSNPSPSTAKNVRSRGSSSVGRASAFQAERRRFEPGLPLAKARQHSARPPTEPPCSNA